MADLGVVVKNLNAPARLLGNGLCTGDSMQVELCWPGSSNPFGISAVVTLTTFGGAMTRDLRAGSGCLSGGPVHALWFSRHDPPAPDRGVRPDGVVTRHVSDIPSLVIITRS
jgi:hypothetical protein